MLGMQRNRTSDNNSKNASPIANITTKAPPVAHVDVDIDVDIDVDVDVEDVDVDAVPAQKPHFLDYDAVPPPEFEESFDHALSFGIIGGGVGGGGRVQLLAEPNGEQLKLDKKYERDGEISDYELAASGYTKKEFTQDDNTLHLPTASSSSSASAVKVAGNGASGAGVVAAVFAKPKHFLDENPIPPDYMLLAEEEHALREHRSLDRNFERHSALQQQQQHQRSASPAGSSRVRSAAGGAHRASRERFKEPSYTLSRFLDSNCHQQQHQLLLSSSPASLPPRRMSKGGVGAVWSDSFDDSGRRYASLHLPTTTVGNAASIDPTNASAATADVVAFSTVIDSDTLGPKVECVYSLLSMLGSNDPLEMAKKFVELSRTAETCSTLRRSGCIPLLVQMIHSADDGGGSSTTAENSVRRLAGKALHNVVHYHPDERAGRREAKVLRLLDQIMDYCAFLRTLLQSGGEAIADDSDRHPLAAISSLMKVSFDEEHRHAMCELGALLAIPALVHLDHAVHGPRPEDQCCNSLRRYALMALTNLTFGDENNKALLCGQMLFMEALVAQLDAAPDDLLQVTASVLRNLSWRADANMKAVLNEIGTVTALARAAMHNRNENTLKAILSALWNLSAHCSTNKAEFCAVDGALAFLVRMLTYEGPSKTLKIIENAGGILRNVSSHIAVRENYRQILRAHNCLGILLQQLKSESLTVVSNSCGTLWNLSARCPEDQRFLWDNGAVPMLRSLIHSKHAMISEGSASALKNLLNFRPSLHSHSPLDPIARSMGLKQLPTLNARKQKALAQELVGRKEHTETCDNLDVSEGAKEDTTTTESGADALQCRRYPLAAPVPASAASLRLTRSAVLTKSESRDSVFSAKSDSIYENLMRSQSAAESGRYKTMPPPPPPPPPPQPSLPASAPRFAATGTNVNDMVGSAAPREDGREEGRDVEDDDEEEQPIDYSVKYNEPSVAAVASEVAAVDAPTIGGGGGGGGGGGTSPVAAGTKSAYATYQETDLDQPTDFSLRYAENQIESDADADVDSTLAPTAADAASTSKVAENRHHHQQQRLVGEDGGGSGTEILLILEDSVKCYQTEDTPYVISNAASVTDLRQGGGGVGGGSGSGSKASAPPDAAAEEHGDGDKQSSASATAPAKQQQLEQPLPATTASGKSALKRYQRNLIVGVAGGAGSGGSYTPEKPINYCEEGTPAGYFSRYESLSSLEESPPLQAPPQAEAPPRANDDETAALLQQRTEPTETSAPTQQPRDDGKEAAEAAYGCERNVVRQHGTTATNSNSALETPLMFSRHSSMDSLLLVEVDDDDDDGRGDDKSSVVSDFSRLASGVISPSELPDSPTQSMPQSPRRNSVAPSALRSVETARGSGGGGGGGELRSASIGGGGVGGGGGGGSGPQLRSVFDDGLNTFHVENTPAHFSCATSLSNLSIIVDEGGVVAPTAATDASAATHRGGARVAKISGDEEDEEEEPGDDDDDLLLANCIDMGMKRSAKSTRKGGVAAKNASASGAGAEDQALAALADEPRHYCTEDTPALLSKVGSNTNLSAISICSSSNANNNKTTNSKTAANGRSGALGAERVERQSQRRSLNMSDDVSSNVSELDDDGDGGCGGVLQQCIRDGMQKASTSSTASASASASAPAPALRAAALIGDPIAMMRRGGNDALPPYLPVTDELMVGRQYLVEDSPCNFSLMSGLSNLTVGSSLVGPAVQLKKRSRANEREEGDAVPPDATTEQSGKGRQQPPPQWLDDSLSSLSIDSEDDTNLLSQAIAAGCNRPKSNLGFSSSSASIVAGKRSASLSASQPIPIIVNGGAATSSSLSAVVVVPNAPVPLPPRHYRQRQRHQAPGKQHSRNNQHHTNNNNNNNNGGGDGNDSYSSVDSSDSNDNQQSKSLLELCIQSGMQKATTPVHHQQQQQQHHHHHHNSRRQQLLAGASGATTGNGGRCKSGAAAPFFFTQSNPNLKQFDAFSSPQQQQQPPPQQQQQQQRIFAAAGGNSGGNRHQRERERKDERLLLECINTGITKKIAAGGGGGGLGGTPDTPATARMTPRREQQQHQQQQQQAPPSNNSTVPKNVPATSAAAPGICRPFPSANCNSNTICNSTSNTTSNTNSTTTSSTAAPGVENNTTTIIINSSSRIITSPVCTASTANNNCSISMSQCSSSSSSRNRSSRSTIRAVDGIATSPETQRNLPPRTMADGASPPSPESVRATTNATGCSGSRRSSYSMSTAAMFATTATAASDESNESFIMETTTVSLMEPPPPSASMQSSSRADKHKDPDLMLRSVERLTLEFVSSAEQLRSCDAQDAASRRLGSISSGGGGSGASGGGGGGGAVSRHSTNNTWNEDTCPNDDVSFPSVSVSAPVVASLNYDEDEEEEDDDADLATDAFVDHGELHDFAEITPTNEAQPHHTAMVEDEDEQQQRREREQLLLSLLQGDNNNDNNRTQPSSLGTETETDADTLINESPPHNSSVRRGAWTSAPSTASCSGHSGGIQFQLGGAVLSAAAGGMFYSQQQQQQHHNHLAAMTTMTNSTILACEARALADHIQGLGGNGDGDEHNDDDDYQMASLDLDNVRPPSGMESLNMSGHYNNYYHDMSPSPAHSLQLQQRHAATAQLFASAARSPKLPRKTLPAGLMARRALGSTLPAQLAGSADSINSSSCQMLLDNIRPPSLMDELLDSMMSVSSIQSEVADGDGDVDANSMATTLSAASLSHYETAAVGGAFDYDAFDDNTVTLQSCCDPLPRDGDADSAATPLPSDDCDADADGDGDFSSAESSPRKQFPDAASPTPTGGRRILTAKQKRNLSKDRFKTYTIAAEPLPLPAYPAEAAGEEEHHDEVLQIEIVETPAAAADARGGGERRGRRSSQDRYRTQIIECPRRLLRPDNGDATPPANYCSSLTTSTDDCPSDDGQSSSIRAMTSRFKFINAAATATPTTTASEEDSGGQTTPVVALQPPPPPESDSNNSIECDQNSETESCHGHADKMLLLLASDDDDHNTAARRLQAAGAPRPRIVVPSHCEGAKAEEGAATPTNENAKCAVRGRRKPAYVSPYSMQYQQQRCASSTATARVLSQQQNNNNPSSGNKKATTPAAGVAPKVRPPAPLQRQGTFVKDEPTTTITTLASGAPIPIVASPTKRSSATSKLPTKRATSAGATTGTGPNAAAPPRRAIAAKTPKAQTPRRPTTTTTTAGTTTTTRTGGSTAGPQRSNSNATIRVTSRAARIAVLAQRVSATTPPSRSNSNLNGRASTAAAATRINQAQSRIAGIWRTVNEPKSKSKPPTQTQPKAAMSGGGGRTKTAQTKTGTAVSNVRSKQPQQQQPQQTLIRSTTFDSTPTMLADTPTVAPAMPIAVHK